MTSGFENLETLTHEQRVKALDELERQGPAPCPLHKTYTGKGTPTSTKPGCVCRYVYHWQAHIDRLRLIYAPVPAVRRLADGSAMPWAGTIVSDTFFGDEHARPQKGGGNHGYDGKYTSWRETGDGYEWDDYVEACLT